MPDTIPPELAESAHRAQRDPRLAAAIARQVPELDAAQLDTGIHPECQMLAHSLKAHGDADLAVSQYFAVALQQYQVVRQLIERLFEVPRSIDILDFACGYGRLLRFLVHTLPADRIHAAEIQADAVDWVAGRYGVQAQRSPADPSEFEPGRSFDLIWAASLFSHLPDGLFARWIERVGSLLGDSGVLCFSVHDEALLPPEIMMPARGLHYIAGSENAALDPAIYGTTFVSQDYVERVVAERLGEAVRVRRLPRLLAHEQDVYVLTAGPARDLSALDGFRRGTRGWLDELQVDEARAMLSLAGWAGSLDAEPLETVEIRLDERVIRQPVGEPRPRVAEVLGHPGLAHSGFSCRLDLPRDRSPYLSLSAVAADGERALIYAGALGYP